MERTITISEKEYLELLANKYKPQPNNPRSNSVDYIEGEIWKVIEGTNNLYSISNLGRLRKTYELSTGIIKDFILQTPKRINGRCTAKLTITPTYQINTYIHRLVLEAFQPLPEGSPKMDIIHIDCNNCNNKLENLRWGTHAEAIQHRKNCGEAKPKLKTRNYINKYGKKKTKQVFFSDAEIKKIRDLKAKGISQAGIAQIMGCSQTYVSKVVNHKLRVF